MDILLVNGMGMTRKATDTKMMAHLPMLLHPNPENALVVCMGMGTTYRSALAYGKRVTVVELVKEVADALDYFYEDAAALKAHPGGKIVVNDGRSFLNLTRDTFDIITVDPPPPIDAAGVNNLYSKEFIELARKRLKKGGIMAHWMPLPGTLSGVDDLDTLSRLIRTFAQVFPYTYMHKSIHNIGLHVIGSMEPVTISADIVRSKLSNGKVLDDISEWDTVPPEYFSTGWILFPPPDLVGPTTTDNEPFLEFYLLRTIRSGGQKTHPVSYW
jgi:spermidine synthase